MSDRLVRFPGSSWQEIEALPQPLRWTVQRTIFHLLDEPVPALADPFPRDDPLPGAYELHLPALAWRRRAPDCIVPPEQLLPPRACTAPHVMPLWPAVEVQETDTGADDASSRSPRTTHTSQSDRMKPAMQAAERPRICGGSGGSGGGYRNSPEMRLTEPATMTTPNT